jgi:hypothetical protein
LFSIDGTWRWFITFAQADVYEPRLYEISLDNLKWFWSQRQKIAKGSTNVEREKNLNGILH